MSGEAYFVFAIIATAVVLFASNRVRWDFVALLMVLLLAGSGILTAEEAFAGFGNPVVLLVAGLLVVGEMLDRTGVAQWIGNTIADGGGSNRSRLLTLIMMAAAVLSSVMSSTAVVAIFIPIIFRISRRTGINASRLLLPMSYAAMISGMLTLIATMPNLVISDALVSSGFEPLTFFGFLPVGVSVLVLGIVYVLFSSDRLIAPGVDDEPPFDQRTLQQLWEEFAVQKKVLTAAVSESSPMNGASISEADIEGRFGTRVLSLSRPWAGGGYGETKDAEPTDLLTSGTLLLITGQPDQLQRLLDEERLVEEPLSQREKRRRLQESGAGVVMIHPDCRFMGKSVRQANLRLRFGIHVLGIRRGREVLGDVADTPLKAADLLLVAGSWERIAGLQRENHDFVLLEMPAEYAEARPRFRLAPVAIAILVAMVAVAASGWLPTAVAVVAAAVIAVATRCLTAEDAYRAISWSSLVLLAGLLPVADALTKTGGTDAIVQTVIAAVGSAGPWVMMTLLFFLTAGLSLFLSNTATAVLLAPVAIQTAEAIGVSPYPLAVTVLIAASSAFSSPVASPVVMLVVEPGHYRFSHFLKLGTPLMLIAYVLNLIITPLLYPLQ